MYRIRPNFQGAQFLRIAISKHFAETIFADQVFRVYDILKFRGLNFRGLLGSTKITCLKKFGRIWYAIKPPFKQIHMYSTYSVHVYIYMYVLSVTDTISVLMALTRN